MRKKFVLGLLVILTILLGTFCYVRLQLRGTVLEIRGGVPCITVNTEHSVNTVRLWQNEADGQSYFFLPSCVRHNWFLLGDIGADSLRIDGELLDQGDVFAWEDDRAYELQITDGAQEIRNYTVSFMRSENIPALFIDTASGSMKYLDADKEHEETGEIRVVDRDGNTEYQGALERISGRGNSTWDVDKKPYTIKLTEKYPLCGLEKGDKWNLLTLWREGSKLDNKIAMDLAEETGLAYSPQGTWVDLYLNGQYWGNYLLTESVSVEEGRLEITDLERENRALNADIDSAPRYEEKTNKGWLIENGDNITGGYLIEKDYAPYYELESAGFVTFRGNAFTIKSPQHASKEQVQYIQNQVEEIERLAQRGQSEVWDYLDVDSFVKRFLVDEISLEMDAGVTSMYFYKERNDGKLYSGPIWDYDNAFGDGRSDMRSGHDYQYTVMKNCVNRANRLDWYATLYEMPEVQQRLAEEYEKLLPFFEQLLDQQIDEYVGRIRASVAMDSCRWAGGEAQLGRRYLDYDANVKYTKYFIAQRLNWLCDRWGVEHEIFPTPCSGQMHTVTFIIDGKMAGSTEILDGDQLADLPACDESVYAGWKNRDTEEEYRRQIPIYEDTVFYNERWR